MTAIHPVVRLGELVREFRYGTSVKSGATGLPVLRIPNVVGGVIDCHDMKTVVLPSNEVERLRLQDGDLLFVRTNGNADYVGRCAVYAGQFHEAVFASYLIRARLTENVDPYYVRWFLSSPVGRRAIREQARTSAGQFNINIGGLGTLLVPVPPLDEQRRIVDILNHAASIRRLRDEARAKARAVIPALFVEMFGDPATNPKKWEVRKLSELGSLDRGKSKHRPRNAPILFGGAYPFIQTGDVANSGGVISAYAETYSDAGLAQSKLWPAGTLCVTIAANIAKTGILSFDACFPDSVVGFTPGSGATTRYVQYFLHFLQPYLEKSAPQLAQKNINLEILRDIDIPSPPVALQQEFAERVAEVEAISALNDRAAMAAEQMAQSLMAQMFGQAA